MIRAINAWAIWHSLQGLLLHSIHANKQGAWAMCNINRYPDEPMFSENERLVLGFRAVQVRVKFDEPEEKP